MNAREEDQRETDRASDDGVEATTSDGAPENPDTTDANGMPVDNPSG